MIFKRQKLRRKLRVVRRNSFLDGVFWEDTAAKIDTVDGDNVVTEAEKLSALCQAYLALDSQGVAYPCEIVAYTVIEQTPAA